MKKMLLLFLLAGCCFGSARAQWVSQNAGFTNKTLGFYELSIVDAQTVWAICYDGIGGLLGPAHVLDFTRTTDGGTTWTPGLMGSNTSLAFSNIWALSGTEAWVAMHNFTRSTGGGIFHTTDGGLTWTHNNPGVLFDNRSFPNFVHFKNSLHGIAGGNAKDGYFEIYTTADGGASWTRTPQANIPAYVSGGGSGWFDGFCVLGNTVWFGTTGGQMYKSMDYGQTWTASTVSPLGYDVYEIAFNDDGLHGLTHVRSSIATMLFATSDGGTTWTEQATHRRWKQSKVTSVPGTSLFVSTSVIASNQGSAFTADNGFTWTNIDVTAPKAACRFFNATTGWAGGYFSDVPGTNISGGLYKWNSSVLLATGTDPARARATFSAYPNPATDQLTLSFPEAPARQHLRLQDATGRLVKEFQQTGATTRLSLTDLPKGLYVLSSQENPSVHLKLVKE
jgi:photosystem II stability/assembly factor-like uncharacterized protein